MTTTVNFVSSTITVGDTTLSDTHPKMPEGTTMRSLRREAARLGMKWSETRTMNMAQLWAHLCINSTLLPQWQPEKDTTILSRMIDKIRSDRAFRSQMFIRAEGNPVAEDGLKFLCKKTEEKALNWFFNEAPADKADEVFGLMFDQNLEDIKTRLENKQKKFSNAGARRGTYLPKATLIIRRMAAKGKEHLLNISWDESLDTKGLVEQIVGEENGRPPVLRIRWEVSLKGEDDIKARKELAKRLWDSGYLSSQGILAWDIRNPKVKWLLEKAFPNAVHLAGYNHRLGAPLLPEGFLSNIQVRFWTPMVGDVRQETDGSGMYDPSHPDMKGLVERYGVVPMQFTFLTAEGLFAKGIVLPREGINEGIDCPTGIILDPAQVKGSHKDGIVDGMRATGWLGFMTAWNQDRFYPVGFESLQCLDWKSPEVVEKGSAIMKKFISNRAEVIELQGLEGLMEKAAKSDEHIALVVRLCKAIQAYKPEFNPLSLGMLRDAVNDLLRKFNYILLQGAGAQGAQRICVLDATVPKGKCVVAGFKPGSKCVVWRFPNILPQGNKVLEVIAGSDHHRVGGKIIRNTIFLNPWDLTLGMQGDDDGDMVGVSDDTDLVNLFSLPMINGARKTEFRIEPKGDKKEMECLGQEGRDYLALDPMGPVGIATIWQAEFYALGSFKHALAMGVFIQYAIDSAKRLVKWPDPVKLLSPQYWTKKPDGTYGPSNDCFLDLAAGSPFPYDLLKDFVSKEKWKFPECRKGKGEEPVVILSWRVQVDSKGQKLNKRADLSAMQPCSLKKGSFKGSGNSVHTCHDLMWQKMKSLEASFKLDVPETDVREVLKDLAAEKGMVLSLTAQSWEEYEAGLRKSSGIASFGEAFHKAMRDSASGDDKQTKITEELNKLEVNAQSLSPNEAYTIWYWENTPVWADRQHRSLVNMEAEGWRLKNRPNYAFRIISQCGLLKLLGITQEQGCQWMSTTKVKQLKHWFGQGNSWDELSKMLMTSGSHGELIKDEQDQPVPLHKCEFCKNTMTSLLLQKERKERRGFRPDELSNLVKQLKSSGDWLAPGSSMPDEQDYSEDYEYSFMESDAE